jgi:hypothetical protein
MIQLGCFFLQFILIKYIQRLAESSYTFTNKVLPTICAFEDQQLAISQRIPSSFRAESQ